MGSLLIAPVSLLKREARSLADADDEERDMGGWREELLKSFSRNTWHMIG